MQLSMQKTAFDIQLIDHTSKAPILTIMLAPCKFILDSANTEARDHLLQEIEIMKAIGYHKNVVSMLGCWVNSDPIFLLLEYVPSGDLLHWLRNKRRQVW